MTIPEKHSDHHPDAPRIFIDGQAGTVGLSIRERLASEGSFELLQIPDRLRKDVDARAAMHREADVVVLCLPDSVAMETVHQVKVMGDAAPKILDASTAHRVAPGWTYGFPELSPNQSDLIRRSSFVSNPGCYPTGAIALLRPLVQANIIAPDYPITINAVSGYSGGGQAMITEFQEKHAPSYKLYGLNLAHKHLPELQAYIGLQRRPLFVPAVGNYRQGMLVTVPLHLDLLRQDIDGDILADALRQYYSGCERIRVEGPHRDSSPADLEPEALNGTDDLELHVFAREDLRQTVLVARLDNLGMGAAGTAVRNLRLMTS